MFISYETLFNAYLKVTGEKLKISPNKDIWSSRANLNYIPLHKISCENNRYEYTACIDVTNNSSIERARILCDKYKTDEKSWKLEYNNKTYYLKNIFANIMGASITPEQNKILNDAYTPYLCVLSAILKLTDKTTLVTILDEASRPTHKEVDVFLEYNITVPAEIDIMKEIKTHAQKVKISVSNGGSYNSNVVTSVYKYVTYMKRLLEEEDYNELESNYNSLEPSKFLNYNITYHTWNNGNNTQINTPTQNVLFYYSNLIQTRLNQMLSQNVITKDLASAIALAETTTNPLKLEVHISPRGIKW